MPNHNDVERRAYELYEARGRADGRDWDDWLEAERELSLTDNTTSTEVTSSAPRRQRNEQRQPTTTL